MRFGKAGEPRFSVVIIACISFSILLGCQAKQERQGVRSDGLLTPVKASSQNALSPAISAEIQSVNDTLNASEQYSISAADVDALKVQGILTPEDEALLTAFIKN